MLNDDRSVLLMTTPPIPGNQSRWVSQGEGGQNRPSRNPTQRVATNVERPLRYPCRVYAATQTPVLPRGMQQTVNCRITPCVKKGAVHTQSNEIQRAAFSRVRA